MTKRILTEEVIATFKMHLIEEEKSAATVEKYIRDVTAFALFTAGREITKELIVLYNKNHRRLRCGKCEFYALKHKLCL